MTTKRSKIRDSARGESCDMWLLCCNRNPETTVYAHTGSGTDKRNPEHEAMNGVYACSDCHDAIDFRSKYYLSNSPGMQERLHRLRDKDIEEGKARTQIKLIAKGLLIRSQAA